MATGGAGEARRPRYRIEFARSAHKELEDLSKSQRRISRQISRQIDALADSPRPHGVTKLKGEVGLYRIVIGDFRVIYTIKDDRLLILVLRVANRRDAYRP